MKKVNNRGFTLIELLAALAIVSLGIITMFSAVNSNLKANTKNDKDIKSLQVAQSEIENLRSQIKFKSPNKFNISMYDEENKEDVLEEISLEILGNSITYSKIINNEANVYNVNLKVTKDQNDLYTIEATVSSENEDFSKKSTNIVTKVFGK